MVQKSGLKTATVFLGGGRITSALCSGLRLGRYESDLVVYDRNPSKLRALRRESGIEIARDLKSAIERAHMLILAVRPASVLGLLDEIARSGIAPGLCVSLAAGVPLSTLRRSAGAVRWVRAMPSPVCRMMSSVRSVETPELFFGHETQSIPAGARVFAMRTISFSICARDFVKRWT